MSVTATYLIRVDWNGDGDFLDSEEDITDDVLSISTFMGRDYASQLTGKSSAGTLSIELDNTSGKYNSFYSSSPIYGNILPGRLVEIQADATVIWTGYLKSILPSVEVGPKITATLEAEGPFSRITGKRDAIPMAESILTGDAEDDILDSCGFPAGDRDIDTGQTTMLWWIPTKGDPLSLARDVEDTENGFLRETKDGKIAFEDRHHRLLAPHTTSQATYTDAPAGTLVYNAIAQEDPLQQIFNTIEVTIKTFTTAGAASVLWTCPESGADSPSVRVGESKTFVAEYPNQDSANNAFAVNPWTTTTATTDMTANSAADGSGTDMTGDIGISVVKTSVTMRITLTNNGSQTAYITLLQARGKAVTLNDPVTISESDSTSEGKYGERTWPVPGKWVPDTNEGQAAVEFLLSIYKDPIPILTVTFCANKSASILTECLDRDVSDRVTLVAVNNTKLGINEDFFVESIQHEIGEAHWTTFTLSPASGYSGFLVLDTSELDDPGSRLAY